MMTIMEALVIQAAFTNNTQATSENCRHLLNEAREVLWNEAGIVAKFPGRIPCTPIDHNEAWSLAHVRRDTSNLARCYIELREAARKFEEDLSSDCDGSSRTRLRAILHAND